MRKRKFMKNRPRGMLALAALTLGISGMASMPAFALEKTDSAASLMQEILETVGDYDILTGSISLGAAIESAFRTGTYTNPDNYKVTLGSDSAYRTVVIEAFSEDTTKFTGSVLLESVTVDTSVDTSSLTIKTNGVSKATEAKGTLIIDDILGSADEDLDTISALADELMALESDTAVYTVSSKFRELDISDLEETTVIVAWDVYQGDDGNWYLNDPDYPITITMRGDQSILFNIDIPEGCESLITGGWYADILEEEMTYHTSSLITHNSTTVDALWERMVFNFGSYDGEITISEGYHGEFIGTLLAPDASVYLNGRSGGTCICRSLTTTAAWVASSGRTGCFGTTDKAVTATYAYPEILVGVNFVDEEGNLITESITSYAFTLITTDEAYEENTKESSYAVYGYGRSMMLGPLCIEGENYFALVDAADPDTILLRFAVTMEDGIVTDISCPDGTEVTIVLTEDDLEEILGETQEGSFTSRTGVEDTALYLYFDVLTQDAEGNEVDTGETYTFTLQEYDGTYTTAIGEAMRAGSDENGTVLFEELSYGVDDSAFHYYLLTQEEGENSRITYDTEPVRLIVYVWYSGGYDTAGYLRAALSSPDGIADVVNIYTAPDPVSLVITLSKELTDSAGSGRKIREGEFTFTLTDENGETTLSATNDSEGTVTFEALTFEEEGSFTFTVSEKAGEDAHIGYDETIITVTVSVTDTEEGLSLSVKSTSQ